VLTDLGGVRVDPGLDDGSPGESYDINLMDRAQFDVRWAQYAGDSPAFDRISAPVTVVGAARVR
jgi:hypothetical protein